MIVSHLTIKYWSCHIMPHPFCSCDMLMLVSWPDITMILVSCLIMMCCNGQKYTFLHLTSFWFIIKSTLSHVPNHLSQPSKTMSHLHLGSNRPPTLCVAHPWARSLYNKLGNKRELVMNFLKEIKECKLNFGKWCNHLLDLISDTLHWVNLWGWLF